MKIVSIWQDFNCPQKSPGAYGHRGGGTGCGFHRSRFLLSNTFSKSLMIQAWDANRLENRSMELLKVHNLQTLQLKNHEQVQNFH